MNHGYGIVSESWRDIESASSDKVLERARELAGIHNPSTHQISKSDIEQALREHTGGADHDIDERILESVTEHEHWGFQLQLP